KTFFCHQPVIVIYNHDQFVAKFFGLFYHLYMPDVNRIKATRHRNSFHALVSCPSLAKLEFFSYKSKTIFSIDAGLGTFSKTKCSAVPAVCTITLPYLKIVPKTP